jgi:hypothetical protein
MFFKKIQRRIMLLSKKTKKCEYYRGFIPEDQEKKKDKKGFHISRSEICLFEEGEGSCPFEGNVSQCTILKRNSALSTNSQNPD